MLATTSGFINNNIIILSIDLRYGCSFLKNCVYRFSIYLKTRVVSLPLSYL